MPSYTKKAFGPIKPMRFVKLTAVEGQVVQAVDAASPIYGVSGQEVHFPPYASLDDGLHADVPDNCLVYGPPEKDVPMVAGAAFGVGARLTADSEGRAVTTTVVAGANFGAISMEISSGLGDIVKVQLVPPTVYAIT